MGGILLVSVVAQTASSGSWRSIFLTMRSKKRPRPMVSATALSAYSSNHSALGTCERIGRIERRLWIFVLEVIADDRGIRQRVGLRQIGVAQNRDALERADLEKLRRRGERIYLIEFVIDALLGQDHANLAHEGRHVGAVDDQAHPITSQSPQVLLPCRMTACQLQGGRSSGRFDLQLRSPFRRQAVIQIGDEIRSETFVMGRNSTTSPTPSAGPT